MITIVHVCHNHRAARLKFHKMEATFASKSITTLEITDGVINHLFVGQENFVSFINSRRADQLVISEYVTDQHLYLPYIINSRLSNKIVYEKRGTYEFC